MFFTKKKANPHSADKKQLTAAEWGTKYTVNDLQKLLDSLASDNLSAQSREMLKLVEAGSKVMEIASGSGQSSLCLAMAGADVTLLDYALEPLELGTAAAKKLGLTVKTIQHDLLSAPPENFEKSDFIFHAGLLEHFDKEQQVVILKNMRPFCRKMVSMVPNAASLAYRLGKELQERNGTWPYGREAPLYTQRDIFHAAGYDILAEYTIGNLNATNFLDNKNPVKKIIKNLITENILTDDWHQGYLLVTIGESLAF